MEKQLHPTDEIVNEKTERPYIEEVQILTRDASGEPTSGIVRVGDHTIYWFEDNDGHCYAQYA